MPDDKTTIRDMKAALFDVLRERERLDQIRQQLLGQLQQLEAQPPAAPEPKAEEPKSDNHEPHPEAAVQR